MKRLTEDLEEEQNAPKNSRKERGSLKFQGVGSSDERRLEEKGGVTSAWKWRGGGRHGGWRKRTSVNNIVRRSATPT